MAGMAFRYSAAFPVLLSAALYAQIAPSYKAFVTGSGYTAGPQRIAVAPGQVATFFLAGLPRTASGLAGLVAVMNIQGTGKSVAVLSAKPVDDVTLAVTVQIPFDVVPETGFFFQPSPNPPVQYSIQFGETSNPSAGLCAENVCTPVIPLFQTFAAPHIINTCDIFYSDAATGCQSAILHQNGQPVTSAAPATPGEVLTIWALGLGAPVGVPQNATGPIAMDDITLDTGFTTITGSGTSTSTSSGIVAATPYQFAGLQSPTVGLYQVNFAVPVPPINAAPCAMASNNDQGNFSIDLGRALKTAYISGRVSGFGGRICVLF